MYTERGSFREIEILPASEQYWVLLKDVTCSDVNAVLGIYNQATGKQASPIEKEEFLEKRERFLNGSGIVSWGITTTAVFEWRRIVNPDGVYIRFKFGGKDANKTYSSQGASKTLQTLVDNYFKDRSKPLDKLILPLSY